MKKHRYFLLSFMTVLACTTFTPVQAAITSELDTGDQGKNITTLQSYLATNPTWYPTGLVTAFYGPLTQSAVQRFQTEHSIIGQGTPATTGYGRVGPLTLTTLNAIIGGSTGDENAPLIRPGTAVAERDTATIRFSTNERAVSRVMYAKTWPFVYSDVESESSVGYGTTTAITLQGLEPNTTYYFMREAIDPSGNTMLMAHESFITNK